MLASSRHSVEAGDVSVGVCWGRNSWQSPPPDVVVQLLKARLCLPELLFLSHKPWDLTCCKASVQLFVCFIALALEASHAHPRFHHCVQATLLLLCFGRTMG